MMDERYCRCVAAGGIHILGQWLPRFTLWHALQLELLQSPFASGDPYDFVDLVSAVRICQAKPMEPFSFTAPTWRERRRFNKFRSRTGELADALTGWILDHSAGPDMWQSDSSSAVKVPWPLYLVTALRLAPPPIGLSEADAWAMSPGAARWLLSAVTEVQGGDPQIVTEAEREAMAAAEASATMTEPS